MSNMVYMVTSGSYSDYGVNAIFSTREKAEEFIALFPNGECNGVTEMEIDPQCVEFRKAGRLKIYVQMLRDGTVEGLKVTDPSSRYEAFGSHHIWRRATAPANVGRDVPDCLCAYVWATDETHAVKIVNEIRTRMIAIGEWA